MIAAVIVLAAAMLGAVAGLVTLALKALAAKDETVSEVKIEAAGRDQLAQKELEVERTKLELVSATGALATERTRAKALEDYVASIATSDPNGDLAPDDVAGRLARLSRQLGAAAEAAHPAAGGSVRADPQPAVPAKPGAAEGKGAGPDDLLRPE